MKVEKLVAILDADARVHFCILKCHTESLYKLGVDSAIVNHRYIESFHCHLKPLTAFYLTRFVSNLHLLRLGLCKMLYSSKKRSTVCPMLQSQMSVVLITKVF